MKATFFLIIATVLWGLNFHFAKVMLGETHFIEAAFWRYAFGIATLVILSYKSLPNLKFMLANLKSMFWVGFIGLFGFNVFFFLGMKYTSAVNAALIISLNPALTVIFSHLILKTPLKTNHFFGLALALVGVIYLLTKGVFGELLSLSFTTGDLLILVANILFALHHVWVRKYAVGVGLKEFTLMTNFTSMVGFVVVLMFSSMGNVFTYSGAFWLSAIGIGTLGTAIAFLTWNEGVRQIGANKAGIFMNLVPLSAAVTAVFFNQELYLYHLWSGLMIIMGLMVMQMNTKPKFSTR